MSVKSQKAQRIAKRRKQKQLTNLGLISLGGLILIALAVWLIKSNQPAPKVPILVNGAPSLKVDKEKVDLGDKRLGSIAAVSFVVSNQGDQPLKFGEVPYVEVKEGCWPPQPTIGSMVLQPGESTKIDVQFLMHDQMGGKHDFSLHMKTNDPKQEDATVTILSNWIP